MEDMQLFEMQEQGKTQEENQVSNPSSITRESMIVADLNLQIEALQKKKRNLTNIVLLGFSILIIMLVLR